MLWARLARQVPAADRQAFHTFSTLPTSVISVTALLPEAFLIEQEAAAVVVVELELDRTT